MPNTPKGLTYPSSSSPVAVPADIQELATDVDGLIVPNTGGTYTGSVSFTQSPSVPTPTSGLHAVNKTYADAINTDVTALETELGTNPSGTFSTVVQRLDSYTSGFNQVGNLYTANRSTGRSTEWSDQSGTYVTISNPTATSVRFTQPASNPMTRMSQRMGYENVVQNEIYTYTATVDEISGGYAQLVVSFRTSDAGTTISTGASGTLTSPGTLMITVKAPVGATVAHIWHNLESTTTGSTVVFSKLGYWVGAAGRFSAPGVPVVGQSHIAVNDATNLSGTGAPEYSVAASPGSTYLQVGATNDVKGWIKWIKATGTSTTGWIAGPEADTGWRDISSMLLNGWTINAADGAFHVRRVGNTVTLRAHIYNGTLSSTMWTAPSGFRPSKNTYFPVSHFTSGAAIGGGYWGINGEFQRYTSNAAAYNTITVVTNDAWPSSLPGTAA